MKQATRASGLDVVSGRERPFRLELSALGALFVLTLRQNIRGKRLLVLSLLFLLPIGLAVLLRSLHRPPRPEELEFALVFYFIPHALAPLAALLYATSMIGDEIEEQTLTYLLLRPLPRWALYLTKWLATLLTTTLLTIFFTSILYMAIYVDTPEPWPEILRDRIPKVAIMLALAQTAYCALFGSLTLLTRWPLVGGVVYMVALEGFLANLEFIARGLTVVYYFRVLGLRWLDLSSRASRDWQREWSIDLTKAADASTCVLTLLGVGLVVTMLCAVRFMTQEIRMKTPEGS